VLIGFIEANENEKEVDSKIKSDGNTVSSFYLGYLVYSILG